MQRHRIKNSAQHRRQLVHLSSNRTNDPSRYQGLRDAYCTCVMGDSEGDMVGDSCLARPLRCSAPGDRVRGLMGAGRRRGELLDIRRDELMAGLLSDDCSWQLLRDAWIEGLLSEEDSPAGTGKTTGHSRFAERQSANTHLQ